MIKKTILGALGILLTAVACGESNVPENFLNNDSQNSNSDADSDGDVDSDNNGDDDDNDNNDNDNNDDDNNDNDNNDDDNNDNDNNDDDNNDNDNNDDDIGCEDEDDDWWCASHDCNDEDSDVHPGAEEILGNNIDDDCDGKTDEETEQDTDIGPIEMDCSDCIPTGNSLDNMICAIDLCDTSVVLDNQYKTGGPENVSFSDCTPEETYQAVNHFGDSTNDLAPILNNAYALMATGKAEGTNHNTSCSATTNGTDDFPGDGNNKMYDVAEWTLKLKAPEQAKSFSFKYVFFSEEYDEFISSSFNDKFYVIIKAQSTQNAEPTVINYTSCRNPDEYSDFECTDDIAEDFGCEVGNKYCFIAINSAFSDCCWYDGCPDSDPADNTNIEGTGFSCAPNEGSDTPSTGSSTGWLQTAWPIKGGEEFTLTFHLHDTSDAAWDSEVIIDSFQFSGGEDQGTIIIQK